MVGPVRSSNHSGMTIPQSGDQVVAEQTASVEFADHGSSHEHWINIGKMPLRVVEAGFAREELNNGRTHRVQIERACSAQIGQQRQPVLDPHPVAVEFLCSDGLNNDP